MINTHIKAQDCVGILTLLRQNSQRRSADSRNRKPKNGTGPQFTVFCNGIPGGLIRIGTLAGSPANPWPSTDTVTLADPTAFPCSQFGTGGRA